LLDLKRITQLNSQNAIIVRGHPGQTAAAEKMTATSTKPSRKWWYRSKYGGAHDRLRDLGILRATASVAINRNTTTREYSIDQHRHHSKSASPPERKRHCLHAANATASAILSDTSTKIIQNPEVRSIDGQTAKLKIGDRIPVATGSFSSGLGLRRWNRGRNKPLVNTQFTYLDVGVNIDLTLAYIRIVMSA